MSTLTSSVTSDCGARRLTEDQFVAALWRIMADGHCARKDAQDVTDHYPLSKNN
ncbi:hypothetical protein [Rhodococcus koreensis]|uniref:hypothetical protein n=1 Tax=Rhodococcus koreensis TaxID=99653 RepID=UPI003671D603